MSFDTWPADDGGAARRIHRRWYVEFESVLKAAGIGMNCSVYDLSPSGACVQPTISRPIDAGDQIEFELPGYGLIPAEVRYNEDGYLGLKFLHDADASDGLARYLIKVDRNHRDQDSDSGVAVPNEPAADVPLDDSAAASESPPSPSDQELQEIGRQIHTVISDLKQTVPAGAATVRRLDGLLRALVDHGARLEEDVRSLRQERDRLSQLLEALVEQLEVHVENVGGEAVGSAGGTADGDSRMTMAEIVLDMRRAEDADAGGEKSKDKAKALMDRLRQSHGTEH